MTIKAESIPECWKSTRLIHISYTAGMISIYSILLSITEFSSHKSFSNGNPEIIFTYIAMALIVVAIFIIDWLFKKHLRKLRQKENLLEKIKGYRSAFSIKLGIVNIIFLINAIYFGFSGNPLIAGMMFPIFLYTAANLPLKKVFVSKMNLKTEEETTFINA